MTVRPAARRAERFPRASAVPRVLTSTPVPADARSAHPWRHRFFPHVSPPAYEELLALLATLPRESLLPALSQSASPHAPT